MILDSFFDGLFGPIGTTAEGAMARAKREQERQKIETYVERYKCEAGRRESALERRLLLVSKHAAWRYEALEAARPYVYAAARGSSIQAKRLLRDIDKLLAEPLIVDVALTAQAIKWALFSADGVKLSACQKEALSLIATKLARIANGDPRNPAHWRDIAGYANLVLRSLGNDK